MSVILIADDNPHAHRMGKQILTQEGYEVATASDGNEAMAYLENTRPDLVMADTRMPGPSGFDICRHVKSAEELKGVRVVLLAGPLEPFDPSQAEEVCSDAVLHKPLDAYTLIETVKSLIGASAHEDEAVSAAEAGDSQSPDPESQPDFDPDTTVVAPLDSEVDGASAEAATEESESRSATEMVEEAAGVVDVAVASPSADPVIPVNEPAASSTDDPLADLVDIALGKPSQGSQKQRIEVAVAEVLEAAMPALVQTIAERVMEKLEED